MLNLICSLPIISITAKQWNDHPYWSKRIVNGVKIIDIIGDKDFRLARWGISWDVRNTMTYRVHILDVENADIQGVEILEGNNATWDVLESLKPAKQC